MVAFEKIKEFGALMDKRSSLWDELDRLMYRCLDDSSLIEEYSRKVAEYREFAKQIIEFKMK